MVDRVDGDDVGVLQLGECLRLAEELGRDFQRHEAVGQVPLLGEVHPAECSPAQLSNQVKAHEIVAHLGHCGQAAHQAIGHVRVGEVDVSKQPGVAVATRE